ncbi:MAG: DUF6516 family protein [Betaproteobacteria bacterium]|nr:DUF6516 family protein [Betaproteobacteria bacterium]
MERKAELVQKERIKLGDDAFAEVRIWAVPQPVRGSAHGYKYALTCVVAGECVLRYDNESGKGDHKHVREAQVRYTFSTLEQLIEDFWADVAQL